MLAAGAGDLELAAWVSEARSRTLSLFADLSDGQLLGPELAIVNPLRWEAAHVAWFQEKWVLRVAGGQPPLDPRVDALYDSAAVPHDRRWRLPLLPRVETEAYLKTVRDAVIRRCGSPELSPEERYYILLSLFHEDMHTEAFTYTRQTHGWAPPSFLPSPEERAADVEGTGPWPGDVEAPGGSFPLGASTDEPFVFDNEKWAHPVELAPFGIARAPVTQAEYRLFVEDGGYHRAEWWDDAGWRWRGSVEAAHPVYWRPAGNREWLRREFDRWVPLEPHRPVLHVNWHEATAYCRWAGRRLPTEAEWEMAAAWDPETGEKRRYPWGNTPPESGLANLDWRGGGCVDVAAYAAGDSPVGCRQMLGNTWEWTATAFAPYPGFTVDPYREYSEPWFHTHQVLRGGCWATRGRLIRNTWRNFYRPERRDVWAGFRTCALS